MSQFVEEYLPLLDECVILTDLGEREGERTHDVGEVRHSDHHEYDNEDVLCVVDGENVTIPYRNDNRQDEVYGCDVLIKHRSGVHLGLNDPIIVVA